MIERGRSNMEKFQVVVAGGRDFANYPLLCKKLDHLFQNRQPTAIISGLAIEDCSILMHQRLLGFRSQAGASFYKNSSGKAHLVKRGGSSQGPSFLYSTPSKIESGIFAYYTLIHCDVENQDRKGVKYMPNWVASHAIF